MGEESMWLLNPRKNFSRAIVVITEPTEHQARCQGMKKPSEAAVPCERVTLVNWKAPWWVSLWEVLGLRAGGSSIPVPNWLELGAREEK